MDEIHAGIRRSPEAAVARIGQAHDARVDGTSVETWLDVELSKVVQNTRVDLLGETVDKGLVHLELQSGNDATMPLRMAEYCLGVLRLFGRFPRQVLLYLGEAPLRMETELLGDDVWFRYRAVDIRDLDGDRLLESEEVGDTVIAILARLRDHKDAVRRILERIAGLLAAERETALGQLLILAGLRHFEETVCRLKHKLAAREGISWPALRQNPFKSEQRGSSPTVSSEA
jgi:hypothetical protein